jgi:hypothetical protein
MKPLLIIVPILLIGGVIGAGAMGVIPIPGISPKKAEAKANAMYGEEDETAAVEEEVVTEETQSSQESESQPPMETESTEVAPPQPTEPTEPTLDPVQGAKALAKYWDEIETTKLIAITDTYKESDLAPILYFMNKKKVAELLSRIPASRAANLSRELQRLASVVAPAQ